jgi:tripartite-type tricarboxylate transporter receptor subunit TctC
MTGRSELDAMTRRILIAAAGALFAAATFPQAALAQFYKDKTVTMIINYPAGGPSDIEGRIVAQHLPDHIPGKPNVVIKNVGGAGGIIGSNQLGEAAPNGDTIGFFTLDIVAQLVGNPSLRTNYENFVMIAGVENPLVAYARKDTPPGLKVATDIMKAHDFKALSLNVQNSNTVNQALSLDLLGIKYQAVPAYRGLKDVETAILQNIGQMANTSLPGWYGSVLTTMGNLVIPLWQITPRRKDGSYPRTVSLPDLPTFEEFYASVNGGKKPSGFKYEILRTTSDPLVAMFRTALMPPKSSGEPVQIMRAAFVDLWKDKSFLDDYTKIIKTPPVMVSGEEAQEIVASLGNVKPEVKPFLIDYANHLVQ